MAFEDELICPSPIIIEQRDVPSTLQNDRAREPIKQVSRKTEITLEAQVSWGKSARVEFEAGGQGGVGEGAVGYLVFRKGELKEKGVTLSRGDRCTSIGGETVDVYLTDKLFIGHIHGAPAFEIWDIVDYAPSKVRV